MEWNRECELLKGFLSEYDKGYLDGKKETAEKIYNFAKDFFTWDEEGFVRELAEYIENFGVKIKE